MRELDLVDHTVNSFDDDIGLLRAWVAEMGGLAEVAIAEANAALADLDVERAANVIKADHRINALAVEVDRLAVQVIALRATMADDLRGVIAALKISGVVERICDHATNAAEMVYFAATGLYFSQREMAALNEKA
jgi:phosphate transport system protein